MTLLPMSRIAIRNLLTKPATRRYPFVVREPFAASRGRILIDHPACTHCMACARRCPAQAIVVDRKEMSWSIDRFACVICGVCVRVCPAKCLSMSVERLRPLAFAEASSAIEIHRAAPAVSSAAAPDPGAPHA